MTESDVAFDLVSSFEPGEVAGGVGLGKFEAMYSELFAEVIDDGVITAEERAQLERTATALGLDRERLRALEGALQSVYELRHRVKIVEVDELGAPSQRGSLVPLEPATDARTQALERRVAQLEARIAQLEKELEEARANVSVEVDLSGVEAGPARPAADVSIDPEALQRRLAHDPRDVETLRALYRAYGAAGDGDRQGCLAHALVYLGAATEAEKATFVAHRTEGLIKPARALSPESFRRFLLHPDEEVLTGEIFAVIVSAVLLGRVAALRRDKQLPALDPARKQDPAQSTLQAVRCFSWAASILGMRAPALYADPDYPGLVEMVPGVPPSTRLGQKALSGRSPHELAFVAGRHLAWYRQERFVRLLVPQIADLEDLFLAALVIGNPGIPMRADTKRRVSALGNAIQPLLEPVQIDRLRGAFLRFVEEGGRTNLQRWASAADRTAARAGLLLAGDLRASAAMLEAEDAGAARERIDDLIVFLASDRHANLRHQLGLSAGPGGAV
jgi:DNA-binding protein YbaB